MENSTHDASGDEMTPELYKIILIVSLCAIVLGITANCFIIISFCKVKLLRTVTNYFIVQLGVADIFLLLSLAIWMSFSATKLSMSDEQKQLTSSVLISIEVFSSSASLTSLACVSIDRCLAVTVPLRYQSITTHSRALVVVLSVWSYSMITFITSYSRVIVDKEIYNKIYITCLFSFTFALPILITTWSYYRIFCAVWRQVHHLPKQTTPNRRFRMVMKEFRIAINILVTILPTYLLWGSFWVATLREAFLESLPNYTAVENWLLGNTPHFAATVNPLIYIAMTRDFRRLFMRLVSCSKHREEFSLVVDSSRQRSVSTRSCSTTQSIPLVDVVSSQDFAKSFTLSDDGKSGNGNISTESSFVTSSIPEDNHELVSF
ncbi:octopamine receptor beta-1R-like [Dendronephthya gigantea]|uniref:octopamine receptor beta-1R-like n=1 Tax=Dendronephthya gigantea TaxID=151771 RepID=UPI00106B61D9|nr:octopamine receptor beta-1R-like [Dendronephthya gigantea]